MEADILVLLIIAGSFVGNVLFAIVAWGLWRCGRAYDANPSLRNQPGMDGYPMSALLAICLPLSFIGLVVFLYAT